MVKVTVQCSMCGSTSTMHVDAVLYYRWKHGELIQNVWPNRTSSWREKLKTGFCYECQKAIFAEPEE